MYVCMYVSFTRVCYTLIPEIRVHSKILCCLNIDVVRWHDLQLHALIHCSKGKWSLDLLVVCCEDY